MTTTVDVALTGRSIRSQAFIDGAYLDAASGETFDCVNPADGRTIASVAACGTEDVDRAVRGARAAFEAGTWSRLAPKQRKRVLVRLAELIRDHRDELALLETLDMGKPIRDSRGVDVSVPGIDFLSDKALLGTYYGSGDAARDLPELAALAVTGDLDLRGVVTHVTDLDGVDAALDRLRRGEGARTVVIVDPELQEAHRDHHR